MHTVFLAHASVDKPVVVKLACELLAQGIPVWLDNWEMGVGDPLSSSIESALDGSASVIAVMSRAALESTWVQREIRRAMDAERATGRSLLVPLLIESGGEIPELRDRLFIDMTEQSGYLAGVHRLVEHLRRSADFTGALPRPVLPLVFHRDVELETYNLGRIVGRWVRDARQRESIAPTDLQIVKSSEFVQLQTRLRRNISLFAESERFSSEALADLRRLDEDVVHREAAIRENAALVLRGFGWSFGLSNLDVIQVVRWYSRAAMHDLLLTLRTAASDDVTNMASFSARLKADPGYELRPDHAAWWQIVDPVSVRMYYRDTEGRIRTHRTIHVPAGSIRTPLPGDKPGAPFRTVFDYDTRVQFVLPQMLHFMGAAPPRWDEDDFSVGQQ